MNFANFILFLLLGLLAGTALAQEPSGPGKKNPNGMTDQDYVIQREKLLKRMKAAGPQQRQQKPEQEHSADGEHAQESTYGQGYGSRGGAKESKPNVEVSKPERPERPHIERPGRP